MGAEMMDNHPDFRPLLAGACGFANEISSFVIWQRRFSCSRAAAWISDAFLQALRSSESMLLLKLYIVLFSSHKFICTQLENPGVLQTFHRGNAVQEGRSFDREDGAYVDFLVG